LQAGTSVPALASISLACLHKHYGRVGLAPFSITSGNAVFTSTAEPHRQIECTVGRLIRSMIRPSGRFKAYRS
jgi:urate oxidase